MLSSQRKNQILEKLATFSTARAYKKSKGPLLELLNSRSFPEVWKSMRSVPATLPARYAGKKGTDILPANVRGVLKGESRFLRGQRRKQKRGK